MTAFFKSQFNYFLLSWMFRSCTLNKINRLLEECLPIIYNDNISSFTDHRNIQVLAIELYKIVNNFSPNLVNDCFKLNSMTVYNTRNRSTRYSRPVCSLTWHIITLPFGAENLGTCTKRSEKFFDTQSL